MINIRRFKGMAALLPLISMLLCPPGTAEEADVPATVSDYVIAVIYFRNTGDSVYNPLQNALTDMIITDLSQVPSLTLVERTRMAQLLQEKEFSISDVHAEENLGAAASGLGASKTLTGSFSIDSEKKMKIDASIIKTDDGNLEKAASAEGSAEKFFELEKKLVFSVIDNMGIKLSDEERLKIQVVPTENLLAMLAYGRGLEAQDQGDFTGAAKAFSEAVALDPEFKKAGVMAKKSTADGTQDLDERKMDVEHTGSGPNLVIETQNPVSDPVATINTPSTRVFLRTNSFTKVISSRAGAAFMPEVPVGNYVAGKSSANRAQENAESPEFQSPGSIKTEYSDFKGLGVGDGLEEFNVKIQIPLPDDTQQ